MKHSADDLFRPLGCKECLRANPLDFEITMAFQPIVDIQNHSIYAYESLVRGTDGAGAGAVLSRITDENRYTFDQICRIKAIQLASQLKIDCKLSINFLPNAVYKPETCIRATMEAAEYFNFPVNQIIFEVTESEPVRDPKHLQGIFDEYRHQGFITAIDDFGAGFAGLNLLTKFKPEVLKLDMELCHGVASDADKQTITSGIFSTAQSLGIRVIAEGVEDTEDFEILADIGVRYFQGYLFAKPAIEKLPTPAFPN